MKKGQAAAVRMVVLVGVSLGALLMSGCQSVEAWQKGNLAEYGMRSDRDELEGVMTAHVTFSREASTGGEGVGGGGCGCN
ncbi:DUF4266 domain-containing protein [Pelagicoccus enzymogenes]|uniref:DUF4266 domain-containing protein n=1 Tax=Pelagicoccus enzymogenes TaxID=2773457 RepID=UPI00280F4F29|nr:DUF4266 domain-containing protein [Pelagicoccus enzymogenes]MDQ8199664.1 DUF4266 domain-containing protein [Pelagicoccus enzymogenes]